MHLIVVLLAIAAVAFWRVLVRLVAALVAVAVLVVVTLGVLALLDAGHL